MKETYGDKSCGHPVPKASSHVPKSKSADESRMTHKQVINTSQRA